MARLFFLLPSLPPLKLGEMPSISFAELKVLIDENMGKEEKSLFSALYTLVDLENIRAHLLGMPLDPRGSMETHEIELALQETGRLPAYIEEFLQTYETKKERLSFFPKLFAGFFSAELGKRQGFLRDYLQFAREFRLVSSAFRAKKMKKSLEAELQFEDPTETIVQQILSQKDAKAYEPPVGFEDLSPIFDQENLEPLDFYQKLLAYQFDKVGEMAEGKTFSLDRVLAYFIQLGLLERWFSLEKEKGKEITERILEG